MAMTKSGLSFVMCVALTSFIALSSVIPVAEGKCAGRWAIHACWGGNGKRSGIPAMDEASAPLGLLRKLLLRRPLSPVYTPTADDTVLASLQPEDFMSSPGSSSLLSSSSSSSSSSSAFEKRFSRGLHAAAPLPSSYARGDRLTTLRRMLRSLERARGTLL